MGADLGPSGTTRTFVQDNRHAQSNESHRVFRFDSTPLSFLACEPDPRSESAMSLYKYLSPHFADQMVRRGEIRIGTLYDFRRMEAHGTDRGDKHEGVRITQTDGQAASIPGKAAPRFLREALHIPDNVTLQLAEGAVLSVHSNAPDMYVYCMCSRYSPDLLAVFGGACVEITEVNEFFAAVTQELSGWDWTGVQRVSGFRLAPCEYEQREQTWPSVTAYDPVFRKGPEYAHQREVRAVWTTPRVELSPINLTVPTVRAYCRKMSPR